MNFIRSKVVTIFGGTGSFGKAFLKRAIKLPFREIRVFSRDEKKQNDLRLLLNNNKIKFILGDIRDKDSVFHATRNADFIFHAAALKQVPSCEFYPLEAIKTNVLGTNNIIDCSIENKVKKIICLSTDKAVYPINAMGMTKALMEKIAISKSRYLKSNETQICVTRYGNVLFSRGSVLPLFINQIKNKKNITITNPFMTRFLMTLDEAIDLVLFAIVKGKNGQIIIPKTSATTIDVLTKALLKIFDYPSSKVKIIGTRHGEKLHETLMSSEERFFSRSFNKYFVVNSDNRELNYDAFFSKGKKKLLDQSDYTSANTNQLKTDQVINIINPLVDNLEDY